MWCDKLVLYSIPLALWCYHDWFFFFLTGCSFPQVPYHCSLIYTLELWQTQDCVFCYCCFCLFHVLILSCPLLSVLCSGVKTGSVWETICTARDWTQICNFKYKCFKCNVSLTLKSFLSSSFSFPRPKSKVWLFSFCFVLEPNLVVLRAYFLLCTYWLPLMVPVGPHGIQGSNLGWPCCKPCPLYYVSGPLPSYYAHHTSLSVSSTYIVNSSLLSFL